MEAIYDLCTPQYVDSTIALVVEARSLDLCRLHKAMPETWSLVLVRKGSMTFDYDGLPTQARGGDLLFCGLGREIRNPRHSDDFAGYAMIFSTRFGQQIVTTAGNLWRYLSQLTSHPVISLPEPTIQLIMQYLRVIEAEVARGGNLYRAEVIPSLVRNLLYTVISDIRQSEIFDTAQLNSFDHQYQGSAQSLALFHRFMDLLSTEPLSHHRIDHYASKLCVTSKYLSTVCRRVSQRTARQWICDALVNRIDGLLRYTDKSIKEISVMLGFPNMSVFTKFVKAHLNLTPTQLRRQP